MKYMGSKARFAKEMLAIILKNRKSLKRWYVEPFVGGANMIDKVKGNRIGSDSNEYLIKALELIRDDPYSIPDFISEDDYRSIMREKSVDGLTGYVGFALSFGAKWFGGYRRYSNNCNIYKNEKIQSKAAKNSAIKQSKHLQGIKFICCSYDELEIPSNAVVYCDPPI